VFWPDGPKMRPKEEHKISMRLSYLSFWYLRGIQGLCNISNLTSSLLRFAYYNPPNRLQAIFYPAGCFNSTALAANSLLYWRFFAFFLRDCKKIHKRNRLPGVPFLFFPSF
ncbi:MAG: hypothetical protein LBD47_11995, partial [Treponema sp.]|nr:hypothetical protein [Treponema sp.]